MDASVALVAAYLRWNGYFVLSELPVQVEDGEFRTATDIDLLAIRLPHAAETVPRAGSGPYDLLLGEDRALDLLPGVTDIILGEVKRGRAHLNRALRDPRVLRFALRRTGCCHPADIADHAIALVRRGEIATAMRDGHGCRVRLASFAGHDRAALPQRTLVVPLARCAAFIRERLRAYRAALRGAYFEDPAINLLALLEDLEHGAEPVAREASAVP